MAKFNESHPIQQSNEIRPKTIFIYGEVKCGKTILACSVSKIWGLTVLFNCENRVGHIDESENLRFWPSPDTICDLDEIVRFIGYLRKNPDHGIKNVIFDTLDTLFMESQRTLMKQTGKKSLNFGDRNEIINGILNAIVILKSEFKLNVILTGHEKTDNVKNKVSPCLHKDFLGFINTFCDFVTYLQKAGDGRILYTNAQFCETGVSLNIEKGETLPDEIINPTFEKIFGKPEPQYIYISNAQRKELGSILPPEAGKELLQKLGYQGSKDILVEDYPRIEAAFQAKKIELEAEQEKAKKAAEKQLTIEDYKELIRQSVDQKGLEVTRAFIENEANLSREEKQELQALVDEKKQYF